MQKYFNNVTDRSGNVVPGAVVTVTLSSSGALATIYSDNGVTPRANPITADNNGYFSFYAADGLYTLTINGSGIQTLTISDVLLEDLSDLTGGEGASLVGFLPAGAGAAPRTVEEKLREDVSVTDFDGVDPTGAADSTAGVQAVYDASSNPVFKAGTYRLGRVRVRAGTKTRFERGVVILKDSSTSVIFCNADADDTTTTAYNGDGDISFVGPVRYGVHPDSPTQTLQPYAMVHAKGFLIDGQGGGLIENWTGRHAIEMNACAGWKVHGYTFRGQSTVAGDEDLSECIQWDGSFDSTRFPYGPGAADSTTCQDFEISGCVFDDVYTAYGAHHTDFGGAKHLRARIHDNTILNAKSSGERLRHLKDSHAFGQVINGAYDRASNPRECVNLAQDFYTIIDAGQSGTTAVFWQTSTDCTWGPNSTIRYSGVGTQYTAPYEVGSSGSPSVNTVIHEGKVTPGTSTANPIIGDSGTNTTFISTDNRRAAAKTLGRFYSALNIPVVATGSYLLLAKVSDVTHSLNGTFYARRYQDTTSGSYSAEVTVSSAAGSDGTRRTIWSQSYADSSNAATIYTVTYAGETWLALKPSGTSLRAFTAGASFSGFATKEAGQFAVVAAGDVSSPTAVATTGVQHFASGLRVDGASVVMGGLPTSASGLPTGSLWRNGTVINIV